MNDSISRFHDKYIPEPNSGCWLWIASVNSSGYGNFQWKGRIRQANRVAWEIFTGQEAPSHLCVCHLCDNPCCVNPDHLFLGTHKENIQDCVRKGRARKNARKGEDQAQAKFSEKQIKEIIKDTRPQKDIAESYGCSKALVCLLKNRNRWKHL